MTETKRRNEQVIVFGVLVEFEPDHTPGFLRLAAMEQELSDLVGRPVDLRTPEDLSGLFRDDVLALAETQYGPG